VTWWIGQRRRRWDRTMAALESKLLQQARPSRPHRPDQWKNLPLPVQRYLYRVFPNQNSSSPSLRWVRFQQKGEFNMNHDRWLPFTARQIMTAPGFLWEACIYMGRWQKWGPFVLVCDALVGGEGHLQAALLGVIPVVSLPKHEKDKENLFIGEALRWLAEAPLIPTALLPEQGLVQWSPIPESDHKAKLSLMNPSTNKKLELVATFDPNEGWLTTIEGWRPAADEKNGFVSKRWIGHLSNYQPVHHSMWVPKHLEAGWIENGEETLYFKGDIVHELLYDATAEISVDKEKGKRR